MVPFIYLGAAAVVMIAAAWWRKPAALCPWSFLTTAGAITIGDLVATAMLTMYIYRPGLLPRYPDNYLGVLFAECLFVPAYYTFLSAFSGRYRYLVYSLAVIPVVLLELLFLRLGVYVHRGWTIWYTIAGFGLYSLAAAYLADAFEGQGYTRRHRLLLIAAMMYYAMNLWGLIPVGILRLVTIRVHLVTSAELDLVLSSLLLHALPFTAIGIAGTWFRWTYRPAFLVAIGAGFAFWAALLRYSGVWTGRQPWTPWVEGLVVALVMAGVGWVDSWFSAQTPRRIPPWEPPVDTRPRAPG